MNKKATTKDQTLYVTDEQTRADIAVYITQENIEEDPEGVVRTVWDGIHSLEGSKHFSEYQIELQESYDDSIPIEWQAFEWWKWGDTTVPGG